MRKVPWGLDEKRLIAVAWTLLVAVLVYRLPFGGSNRDEAFYAAMPYSFLLGARPYFDELAMHQNAGILLMPLFKVYLSINGSADGIILFNRYLYLAYLCVCSLFAYRFVLPLMGRRVAAAISLLVLVFSYFNLFALSYNTIGAFGFFCGVLLSVSAIARERPAWRLFGASLFFLSALFAYPGLVPAVGCHALVLTAWLFWQAPRRRFTNALLGLAAGAVVILLVVVPLGLWLGRPGFARLLSFSQSMGYAKSAFENIRLIPVDFVPWAVPLTGFLLLFALLPVLCAFVPVRFWATAPLAVAACVYCYVKSLPVPPPNPAAVCLTGMIVLAPVSVACNWRWAQGRALLALIWLPGAMAMLCSLLASANRLHAASLGALCVELSGVVAFVALIEARAEKTQQRLGSVTSWALIVALLATQTHSLFAYMYDEKTSFAEHDTRVSEGPMRGTIATPQSAELLVAVDRDLKRAAAGAKTITVFDNFATGYLSTPLVPRTFTHWIVWVMRPAYCRAIMEETFGDPERLPDVVLKIRYASARHYWPRFERNRYELVVARPELGYSIFRRRAGS